MIFLVQFGINKHLLLFKDHKLENLLVLIYSKFHSKSCDYLYKLACFELEKTRKSLKREFSDLNPFVSYTKPAKNNIEVFVSCTFKILLFAFSEASHPCSLK